MRSTQDCTGTPTRHTQPTLALFTRDLRWTVNELMTAMVPNATNPSTIYTLSRVISPRRRSLSRTCAPLAPPDDRFVHAVASMVKVWSSSAARIVFTCFNAKSGRSIRKYNCHVEVGQRQSTIRIR